MAANVFASTMPPSSVMSDVHAAWLAAGARSDVATMRLLTKKFPEWLDLQRRVEVLDATQHQTHFCSWDSFCLNTLGASALHTAAWKGDLAVLTFLLESGQQPDSGNEGGMTAMMVAILRLSLMTSRCVFRGGQAVQRNLVVDCRKEENEQVKQVVAVVQLLLHFGANVNAQSRDGKTALHCSTSDESYEVAKLLLDAGANGNTQDENGKTSLHYCIQEGGLIVTNLLLSCGVNIDVVDANGVSPIDLVLQRADLNVLQLFLNHHQNVSTLQRQDFAGALLLQAVDTEVEAVVRFIIKYKYASVTARNAIGETAMHRAILRRSPSIMQLLSDLDPDGYALTAVTTQKKTPAHYACAHGSAQEVQTLLLCLMRVFGNLRELEQHGVSNPLNATDISGRTSLYMTSIVLESESDSSIHKDREAKVRLVLNQGGRLFSAKFLEHALSKSALSSQYLIFPWDVQQLMKIWLAEGVFCEESEKEGVVLVNSDTSTTNLYIGLCTRWLACAAGLGSKRTLVTVMIFAGYAREVLPLLLILPLHRLDFSTLLCGLKAFAIARNSALLLQLHTELSRAWHTLAVTSNCL